MRVLILLACFLVGYLIGSIPFGVVISKRFYSKDIRDYGSHNTGGTNAGRVLGKKAGIIVMLLDIFKLVVPFIIAVYLFEYNLDIKNYMNPNFNELNAFGEGNTLNQLAYYLVPFGAIIGHGYSIYLKFKGGKVVSTFGGFELVTTYFAIPVLFSSFLATLKFKKYVSLASIIASALGMLLGIGTYLTYLFTFKEHGFEISNYLMWFSFGPKCSIYYPVLLIIAWCILVFKHRANIQRIKNGTESKITWMK